MASFVATTPAGSDNTPVAALNRRANDLLDMYGDKLISCFLQLHHHSVRSIEYRIPSH